MIYTNGSQWLGLCLATMGMENAARDAADAMRAFGAAYRDATEREYLRHHDRLPGSHRTRRLRKKRTSRVARWFDALGDAG